MAVRLLRPLPETGFDLLIRHETVPAWTARARIFIGGRILEEESFAERRLDGLEGPGRPGPHAPAGMAVWLTLLCLLLSCLVAPGCAVRQQAKRICLDIEASEDLNLYDGSPHPITLFVYALADASHFLATPTSELLVGHLPNGVLEPPTPVTIEPGVRKRVDRVLPAATQSVGVLADYDREPGAQGESDEGEGLRVVVPPRCGFFTPNLDLSKDRIARE